MNTFRHGLLVLIAALLLPAGTALAQGSVTLPPSGDNQKASVTQYIGLVKVTIDYSSPDVTAPDSSDRRGQIWGHLVPYGLAPNNFGTAAEMPWRAGANENTVFTVSHDVEVEGQPLAAGSYGLHMIPGEDEWTVIFSNNHTAWGSFYYDESEDALRVTVEPKEAPFREWLTYDFIDRQPTQATVALTWEERMVPFTISVDNLTDLYVENMRRELQSTAGFSWQGYNSAAQYAMQSDDHLEQALAWADLALSAPFVGAENATTLQTKAQVLARLNRQDEAKALMDQALNHPTATPFQIHQYGRQLIAEGQPEEALAVFQLNAKRFPDTWPTDFGLARGYSAVGEYNKALEHAKIALERAPDPLNKSNIENAITALENGEDIN